MAFKLVRGKEEEHRNHSTTTFEYFRLGQTLYRIAKTQDIDQRQRALLAMLRGGSSAPETPRRGTGAAETCDSPEAPRRLNRAVKPSAKVREAMLPLERGSEMRGGPSITVRSEGAGRRAGQASQTTDRGTDGTGRSEGIDGRTTAVQKMMSMMVDMKDTIIGLHVDIQGLKEQAAKDQQAMKEEHQATRDKLSATRDELQANRSELQAMKEKIQVLEKAVESLMTGTQALPSGKPSYAEIARTPPSSQPSNVRSVSNTTASASTTSPRCTVDVSGVVEADRSKTEVVKIRQTIETEMRSKEGQGSWWCVAVSRDARYPDRIRITGRDEDEIRAVKEAVAKIDIPGMKILRDRLYPVKVDNAKRTGVIDADGAILPGAVTALETENEIKIAKIRWLSRPDTNKAYGSMVVYVTKGDDAAKLLQGQYFIVVGESANTNVFEARPSPVQCYNCQEMGHKAFACSKPQVCAKCAEPGHRHEGCQGREPKCVPYGGPHESFSRICRARQLRLDV